MIAPTIRWITIMTPGIFPRKPLFSGIKIS